LQSRAALDRKTDFILRQYGNYTDSFSEIRKMLQGSKKDERTDISLNVIDDAKSGLKVSSLKTIHKAILEAL
jgi:hypothetical protein